MSKIAINLLLILLTAIPSLAQTNPSLFDLSSGSYSMTAWASTSPAGTYPANMIFQRLTVFTDPTLTTEMTQDYTSAYSLTSGARIVGRDASGFSFINSGNIAGQGFLGTAVLGLNATGRQDIKVTFTAGTQAVGTRQYALRLQYKIGASGTWTDVPGPVEYAANATANHSQTFNQIALPTACNNQAVVYVRWKYYYFGSLSGSRPELRLDDISVTSSAQSSASNYTTFRTENIEGTNGFIANSEKFNTTRGQISSFVTWDKDYIYVAYSGSTPGGLLTENDRAIHLYIDSDPKPVATQGTGTTTGETWRWTPTLPFSANYHYAFKTFDNTETKRVYSGTAWENATFFTQNFKNTTTGYWEIRIKRSDIGNPKQINLIGYINEDWDNSATITGGLPSNLFTDNTTQGPVTFTSNFLNISFIDKMTPASTFTLNNHGWSVRLKATGGSLVDSTLMAGMFVNATNGYDLGIDHPKTPPAPSNYISAVFPRSSWTSMLGPEFERDFRPLSDLSATTSSWDFTVNSDITGNVTLSASSFEDIPSTYGITLKDITSGTETNLRAGSYTYANGSPSFTRDFRLIIGVALTNPTVSVTPVSLAFDTVKTNATKDLVVHITNTGDQPLQISNMLVSGTGFRYLFNTTTATLNKNDTIMRTIRFAPSTAGPFTGKFYVLSNDPLNDTVEVNLSGVGRLAVPGLAVTGDSLSFGNVIVGSSGQGSVTVSNTGGDSVDLVISNVSLSGTGSAAFAFTGSTPVTITAGNSAQLDFTFTPPSTGHFGASISIASNAPGSPKVLPVGGSGTASAASKNFPGGWNLMSIPLNPVSNLTPDVLAGIPFYYLYSFDGSGYVASPVMNPTTGYWLGIEAPATVNITGTILSGSQKRALLGGWNLIASPFTSGTAKNDIRILQTGNQTVYTIEEATNAGLVQRSIYKFNNSTTSYDTTTALAAWDGHWFFTNTTGLEIRYDLPSDGFVPENKEKNGIESTTDNWLATISATINGVTDKFLGFGTNVSATNGFDPRFDMAKAPASPSPNSVQTWFQVTGWSAYTERFAADVRTPYSIDPEKSWSFKVTSNASGLIKLSWAEILQQIPQEIRNNHKFFLSGYGISTPVNMLIATQYEFNAVAGSAYTFVINSSPVGIDDEAMNLDFRLAQNYPNPFNPSTTISFSIKEAGQVTLKVYDILGNEVTTLVNDIKQPGRYDVRFEAASLPSGTYFYKLVQGKNSEIKKLILLK